MNNSSIFEKSHTDWPRIQALQDEDIDFSDIPEIDAEQMKRSVARFGGEPMPTGKVLIPLLLDLDVIDFFKEQAGEEHYQLLINEMLKVTIRQHEVESLAHRLFQDEVESAQ